jgi:hypothetical protein
MTPKTRRDKGALRACYFVLGLFVFATWLSTQAKADPAADAYADKYGLVVCNVLERFPTFAGVTGIANGIHSDGLSLYQAGGVIATSVMNLCPQYLPLLKAYVAVDATDTTFKAVEKVGGVIA